MIPFPETSNTCNVFDNFDNDSNWNSRGVNVGSLCFAMCNSSNILQSCNPDTTLISFSSKYNFFKFGKFNDGISVI